MVHEARVVRALRSPHAVRLDVLLPASRQVRVQVLDRVELVVEISVDQGRARPQPRLRASLGQGLDHGQRLPPLVITDTARARYLRESYALADRAGARSASLQDRRRARVD